MPWHVPLSITFKCVFLVMTATHSKSTIDMNKPYDCAFFSSKGKLQIPSRAAIWSPDSLPNSRPPRSRFIPVVAHQVNLFLQGGRTRLYPSLSGILLISGLSSPVAYFKNGENSLSTILFHDVIIKSGTWALERC